MDSRELDAANISREQSSEEGHGSPPPNSPDHARRMSNKGPVQAPGTPAFPPLQATATTLSVRQRRAADALEHFADSPENPRNWPSSKKWRNAVMVALAGFISTCGSSIGVPGIHAVRDEFGVDNEKVGILITTFYVLGLGYAW